jgi:hypothetical protein
VILKDDYLSNKIKESYCFYLKKLGLLKQGDLSGKVVVILTLSYLGLD